MLSINMSQKKKKKGFSKAYKSLATYVLVPRITYVWKFEFYPKSIIIIITEKKQSPLPFSLQNKIFKLNAK